MLDVNTREAHGESRRRTFERLRIRLWVTGAALLALAAAPSALWAQDSVVSQVLRTAESYVGAYYCSGGTTAQCFDCSGFVKYVYRDVAPGMPRISRDIARWAQPVARDALQPGDLLFFATGSRRDQITHVAVYLGNDSIIHAISDGPNRGVTITDLEARYWRSRYHSSGRVPGLAVQRVATSTGPEGRQYTHGLYVGGLRDGNPHGQGRFVFANGDVYEGTFADGIMSGDGDYRWVDGRRYVGGFRDGSPDGSGTWYGLEQPGAVATAPEADSAKEASPAPRAEPDEPARPAQPATPAQPVEPPETYPEATESPWETFDGIVRGDFDLWREEQDRAFEEFRRRNEPPRR